MRVVLYLVLLLIPCVIVAKQTVFLAKDKLGQYTKPNDLAFVIFDQVITELYDTYSFKFAVASAEREWILLNQSDNVCVYNKMKTDERLNMAYFSDIAVISFPPNRLISRHALEDSDLVSLRDLVNTPDLLVGVVDGRKYGLLVDEIIKTKPNNFYIGKGNDKASRLRTMLIQGKLDVILEFAMTFESILPDEVPMDAYHVYKVEELANDYVDGFIACSKSEIGKRLIAEINRIMHSDTYRQSTESLIDKHVPKIEALNIKNRIFDKN